MIEIKQADMALIQDRGRQGFEHWGVPASGAWDGEQYERVSLLLQENNPAVFEVLAGTFSFTTTVATDVVLTGFFSHASHRLDHVVALDAGETLNVQVSSTSYVGVRGLVAPKILGSASTDTVSGLGPQRLAPGDRFDVSRGLGVQRVIREPLTIARNFHFIPGPHGTLGAAEVHVTATSRSGIRLQGASIASELTLASLPILPGAIQDTGQELIIVGPDGAVTGGYPVIGVIAEADLPALARINVGMQITLTPVALGSTPTRTRVKVIDLSAL